MAVSVMRLVMCFGVRGEWFVYLCWDGQRVEGRDADSVVVVAD